MLVNPTKDLWWSFSEKVVRLFLGTALTLLIARQMGPAEFGMFSTVLAVFMLFSALASLGLKDILIDEIASGRGDIQQVVSSAAGSMFLAGAILGLIFLGVSALIYMPFSSEFWVATILSVLFLLKGFDTLLFVFEAQAKLRTGAIVQQVSIFISAAAKGVLLLVGASAILLAAVTTIEIAALYTAAALLAARQNTHISFKDFRWDCAMRLLRRSWPMIVSALSVIGYFYIDQIMIAIFMDHKSVGIYATASRISQQLYVIPTILVSAYYPRLTKINFHSEDNFKVGFIALSIVLIAISVLICTIILVFGSALVDFLLGAEFMISGQILALHVLGLIFVAVNIISDRWCVMQGLQRLSMIRHLLTLAINCLLNAFLIPVLGLKGAVYATLLSLFCLAFCFDYLTISTRRLAKIKLEIFKSLVRPRVVLHSVKILRGL